MRVLAVIHYPVFGGTHNNVVRLHAPLAELGIHLSVVLPEEEGNAAAWMSAGDVPVFKMPLRRIRATRDPRTHLALAASLPGDVARLVRIIRKTRADVVLLPGLANPHGAIAGRLTGRAVVWQILDTRTPRAATRLLMPIVRSLADAVMFWGDALIEAHGTPKLSQPVIINSGAVKTELFTPSQERRAAFRAELGVPQNADLVGLVANWYPTKGVDMFVRAAEMLVRQRVDAWFALVGDAQPGHPDYAADIRRGINSSPELRERLRLAPARPDLESVYPAFDLMTVPSVPGSEGLATTVLEAMACGVPVIATDVGATRDAVIDDVTGRLIPPNDSGALGAAIAGLLSRPEEVRRLGTQCREFAVARYDVTVAAKTHAKAFRAAIEHASTKR